MNYSAAKMIVLPGGRLGTDNLGKSKLVLEQCRIFSRDKYVAAVCAAPSILAGLNLMKRATVHPDYEARMGNVTVTGQNLTVDGNVITGQGLGSTIEFSFELIKILKSDEMAQKIKSAICY